MKVLAIMIILVLGFMLFDIVSGLAGALKNGDYKSKAMREGLYHKMGYIMTIMLCALVEYSCKYMDLGFNIPILKPVIIYIILNEIGSIIENIKKINPEILPEKIENMLNLAKDEEGSVSVKVNVTSTTREIKELNPLVQVMLNAALDKIKKKNINPLVVETYRPLERQYYLYGQGRTQAQCTSAGMPAKYAKEYARSGSQVTWTLDSIHIKRCAVDIIPQRKVNGVMTAIWNAKDSETKTIIKIMESVGFEAGANWSDTPDSPHFQVAGLSNSAKYIKKKNTNKYVTTVIQKALKKAGHYTKTVDGIWGDGTTDAVKKFKKANGWKGNGLVGTKCLKKLLAYL